VKGRSPPPCPRGVASETGGVGASPRKASTPQQSRFKAQQKAWVWRRNGMHWQNINKI